MLPVVAPGKASASGIAGALDAIARHADNDPSSRIGEQNTPGLRRRIKELRRQIKNTHDTAKADTLRMKLDVLYDLLVEEAENSYE